MTERPAAITSIAAMLRALWIWPALATVFAGLVKAGVAHGPWNIWWLMAMGCWLALDAYWVFAGRNAKLVISRERLRVALLVSAAVHAVYCLPLDSVPFLGLKVLPDWIFLKPLGALACASGVGFAIWARRVLAGNWNATAALQARHALVRSGPYAVVRHPIYLGFLVTATGMFLALGEVRGLIGICHITQFFEKLKAEEMLLRSTYPEEYREYERRVKRLLPYVW